MNSGRTEDVNLTKRPAASGFPGGFRAGIDGVRTVVGYWDKDLRKVLADDDCGRSGPGTEGTAGSGPSDLLPAAMVEADSFRIRSVLAGDEQTFERRFVDASGGTRHTQVSYVPDRRDGEIRGFFAVATDITDRVQAERDKDRIMAGYRALARSIPGVLVLLFDADLRFIIAEGQGLETFGHRPENLEGRSIHEVFDAELAAELEPRYRAALAGREVSWKRRIGHRTFSLTARPLRSDDRISAGVVVAVDVTERMQREEAWAALHDIATDVARNAAPEAIADRVASIVRSLFSIDTAAVVRFTGPTTAEIIAMSPALPPTLSRKQTFGPGDVSAAARVAVSGKPALVVYEAEGGLASQQLLAGGFQAGAAAPIKVHGRLWGAVTLASRSRDGVTGAMLDRLAEFAELVEIAIGNTEAWTILEGQASTDALTGLPNRRVFEELLGRETSLAEARGVALSAVVLDIDHFKAVNDTYGHLVGDAVLAEVAGRLRRVAREGEFMARFGGEEFVWLLPGTNGDGALQAAERARLAIASAPFPGVGVLTISAGVCGLSDAAPEALMACADRALYAAKDGGRNRSVRFGDPEPDRTAA